MSVRRVMLMAMLNEMITISTNHKDQAGDKDDRVLTFSTAPPPGC
jgi:hypothetical protein